MMPVISLIVRQFLLPNPFAPLGDNAVLINWIFGVVFIPLSYKMVGLIYTKNSDPGFGSFLFLVVYALNTFVTYIACEAWPYYWIIGLIVLAYVGIICKVVASVNNA